MSDDFKNQYYMEKTAIVISWLAFFFAFVIIGKLIHYLTPFRTTYTLDNLAYMNIGAAVLILSACFSMMIYNLILIKYPESQIGKKDILLVRYIALGALLFCFPVDYVYSHIKYSEKYALPIELFFLLQIILYGGFVFLICRWLFNLHSITKFKIYFIYVSTSYGTVDDNYPSFFIESDSGQNAINFVRNYLKENPSLIDGEEPTSSLKCLIDDCLSSKVQGKERVIRIRKPPY